MNMELRDLEYFAVVADHGHVGRAAEALGLGQPAVSKSLRRLEQAVRTKLLRRTPKGVELTEAGAALLSRVSRLRLALGDIAQEVGDIGQGRSGHLRIGAAVPFVEQPLSPACRTLLQDAPNVTLTVIVEPVDVLLPALRKGELDLVVIPMTASPHENRVEEHLFDDEFVVIASVNHRLVKRKRVTLSDLAQERWVLMAPNAPATQEFSRAFQANGLAPPQVPIRTTSLFLRDYLVASSDLLGFSSSRVARYAAPRHRVAELRVKELTWTRRVGMSYRKDTYLSPAARRFMEILKATANSIPVRSGDGRE